MQSDNGQESLWEQSDLLQLMASAERSTAPVSRPAASPPRTSETPLSTAAPAAGDRRLDPNAPPPEQPSAGPAPAVVEPATTMLAGAEPAVAEPAAHESAEPAGEASPDGLATATAQPDAVGAEVGSEPASTTAPQARVDPAAAREKSPAPRLSLANGGRATPTGPPPLSMASLSEGPVLSDGPALSDSTATSDGPAPGEGAALPTCPQRLLILDTETTGLSPEQGQCIEVGAVLFDVSNRAVLMQVSFLLPCQSNPAQHVNGIPAPVSRLNQPWPQGLACFEAMVASADAVLAHNVGFDRQWFGSGELPALEKPWICSMEDIRWPADRHLRPTPSVRDLALAYGVPVWAAHRALTDCIYLVQILERCDDLEALLQQALEPRRLVRARLSYDERQLAKDAGFRWNEPIPKAWSRRLSEREIAALPFPVDPVEADQAPAAGRQQEPGRWRRSA